MKKLLNCGFKEVTPGAKDINLSQSNQSLIVAIFS